MENTEEVLLHIDSNKFLMTPDEALQVASILNNCTRLMTIWRAGGNGLTIFGAPDMKAAFITPFTPMMRVTIEQSTKEAEVK